MRALTLWQPMAWAIAEGHKPVENRTWPLPSRMVGQRFAIHAGKKYDPDWAEMIHNTFGLDVPDAKTICRGSIIAVATFRGCMTDEKLSLLTLDDLSRMNMPAESFRGIHEWFSGPQGFLMSDVQKLDRPILCRGYQGMWAIPADIEAEMLEQVDTVLSEGIVLPNDDPTHAVNGRGPVWRPDPGDHKPVQMTLIDPVMLERERCAGIVRDLAEQWGQGGGAARKLVAQALHRAVAEIEE